MTDSTQHLWSVHIPRAILAGAVAMMAIGYVSTLFAQGVPDMHSQDSINAMLIERQAGFGARLDRIETLLTYCSVGVFGQLTASLFALLTKKGTRDRA